MFLIFLILTLVSAVADEKIKSKAKCSQGYYLDVALRCALCRACMPGQESSGCDGRNNRQCRPCSNGTYSSAFNQPRCTVCDICQSYRSQCNATSNSICQKKEKPADVGIIIAVVIGLLVVLLIMLGALFIYFKRRRRRRRRQNGNDEAESERKENTQPIL